MFEKLNQSTIETKVKISIFTSVFVIVFALVSLYEVAKTGTFTFLEREHTEALIHAQFRLKEIEEAHERGDTQAINGLINRTSDKRAEMGFSQLIAEVKAQPIACLEAVYLPEEWAFRLLGFGEVLDLCAKDIRENQAVEELIENFQTDNIDSEVFLSKSRNLFKALEYNTQRFIKLVPAISDFVTIMAYCIIVVVGLGAICLQMYISRSICNTINDISDDVATISKEKALNHLISVSGGELGVLSGRLNEMFASFRQVVASINENANDMGRHFSRVNDKFHELNQISDMQAHGSEQIAAAITQMTETLREVARNTSEGAESADQVHKNSKQSLNIVGKTLEAVARLGDDISEMNRQMHDVKKFSDDIGMVIEVIGSIAEQTNLLALNAAIEAARAGESGRGFAVVADEVRTLASKTQNSASDIKTMIEKLQGQTDAMMQSTQASKDTVDEALFQAEEAKQSVVQNYELSLKMNDLNTQVATSTEEQHAAVSEINRNIHSILDGANEARAKVLEAGKELTVARQTSEELAAEVREFKT